MTDKLGNKKLSYLFPLIPILFFAMPSLAVGGVDKIGVYRPSQRVFYLDSNGNYAWNASGDRSFRFGAADDVPIVGDWDGDGFDEIGIYRPQHGLFFLDLNGDNTWNASIDHSFRFGAPYDVPIVGDWNGDGVDEVGVYRPQQGVFYLDYDGDNAWNASIDRSIRFGAVNDVPVVGNWNGDDVDEIGVFRNGMFYLDLNGNDVWDGAAVDRRFSFGAKGDVPVSGDWNGDAVDEIGIYRPSTFSFYLDTNGDQAWSAAMDRKFRFGTLDDLPIAGNWNSAPISSTSTNISMSLTPEAADPSLLEDENVSGSIYVFVSSERDITEVRFYLDGTLVKIERYAPYAISGDSNGLLDPFDTTQLTAGSHVISAEIVFADDETEVLTANFMVEAPEIDPPGENPVKEVSAKNITFQDIKPQGFDLDTCWDAIGKDHLGNVYVGLAHDDSKNPRRNNVAMFRYNSKTGRRDFLGTLKDVSAAAGNLGPNQFWPKEEGITKVHSHILEHNGNMYFVTNDHHEKDADSNHRGAHLYSIEIATGTISDLTVNDPLGIIGKPHHSMIPLNIIRELNTIVGMSFPFGDLVVRNLDSSSTAVYDAPKKPRNITREISVYGNKVYFSYSGSGNHLWSLDVITGTMKKTAMQLHNGWISGRDETADGKVDYLMNLDGYLQAFYKEEERIERLGYIGDGISRRTWGLVLSRDEKKLYTIPSDGPMNKHLLEFNIESGNATVVADLSAVIRGKAITGSGVKDDQGRIYFCYHSYKNDAGLVQVDVSGR